MIELDGTENKGRLGANAILAVSMAARAARRVSRYAALSLSWWGRGANTLPTPMMNILNGGAQPITTWTSRSSCDACGRAFVF